MTNRLTADCSTAELHGNNFILEVIGFAPIKPYGNGFTDRHNSLTLSHFFNLIFSMYKIHYIIYYGILFKIFISVKFYILFAACIP